MPRAFKPWVWFFSSQTIAVVALATSGLFMSWLGPALWAVGIVLLLPGEYLLGARVEHALWGGHLGLMTIYSLEILATIAVNALLFGAALWLLRRVRGRGAI